MEHLSVNYYFIVNPNAGTRREQRKLLNSISSGCKASGAEYTLYETSCAGDGGDFMLRTASEQLSACSGDPEKMPQLRFYFAGGDGTVLESANAFMKLPEELRHGKVAVGVLPVGTGNDFLRNFGTEKAFLDVERQLAGNVQFVDLMRYVKKTAENDPDDSGVGEILAKTESRMLGYFEDPEETAKVLLPDGWLATGDYGYIDNEGFLHVTGRKKNVIVTKNGKNIFPEELEYLLNKSDYIKESVVWGDEDEQLGDLIITAEIVTEPDFVKDLTEEEIQRIIKEEVEKVNNSTTSYKRIRKFNLREEEFEKTTTRKIKRHSLDLKGTGKEGKRNE